MRGSVAWVTHWTLLLLGSGHTGLHRKKHVIADGGNRNTQLNGNRRVREAIKARHKRFSNQGL